MVDNMVNFDQKVISQPILSGNNALTVKMLVADFSPIMQNTVKYGA